MYYYRFYYYYQCVFLAVFLFIHVRLPLVIKEPVRLRAESLLEVESQRSSGSDSSVKNPLVRSMGDCSTNTPGDSKGLWLGLRQWLTFTAVISLFRSTYGKRGVRVHVNDSDEKIILAHTYLFRDSFPCCTHKCILSGQTKISWNNYYVSNGFRRMRGFADRQR